MFKVGSLERAVDFFVHVLNARVLRHEENSSNCPVTCNGPPTPSGLWSKTMVGLTDEKHFAFELVYNYGISHYRPGTSLRYLTINIPGAASRAKTAGWKVVTSEDTAALAVVMGPDGMNFRCIEDALSPSHAEKERDPIVSVSLNVSDLDRSAAFYSRVLGMEPVKGTEKTSEGRRVGDFVQLTYGAKQCRLELVHSGQPIDHGDSVGRLAYSTTSVSAVYERVKAAGEEYVVHEPRVLGGSGKDGMEVVIVRDPDGFELCFADEERFDALSQPKEGGDKIHWAEREGKVREVEGSVKREEKEETAEEEVHESGHRLVDESEFAEGGDEKDSGRATEGRGSDNTDDSAQAEEEAFTPTHWESSPHEKIASPAENKINQ